MKNKAFTLIELLVVVLIIGILAAIAVPQYQKAVMKSRLASAIDSAKAIANSSEIYYLAHGGYPNDTFEGLDISFLGYKTGGDPSKIILDNIRVDLNTGDVWEKEKNQARVDIQMYKGELLILRYLLFLNNSITYAGNRYCETMYSEYRNICEGLGGIQTEDSPDGYTYTYKMP